MANTNVFAPATDKFVVIENLSKFWEKSKDYIDTADASIKDDVKSISDAIGDSNTGILKDLADLRADVNGLSGGDSGVGSISTQINNALATLDADDTAVDGKYISSVTQVDGKITVIREDLPDFSEAISDAEQAAKDYADEKVDDVSHFKYALYKHKVGDAVKVKYYRENKLKETTVLLSETIKSE